MCHGLKGYAISEKMNNNRKKFAESLFLIICIIEILELSQLSQLGNLASFLNNCVKRYIYIYIHYAILNKVS